MHTKSVIVHMTHMFPIFLAAPRVTITKDFGHTLSQKGTSSVVPTLEHNNQLFTDNVTKANILNDHFSSVLMILN